MKNTDASDRPASNDRNRFVHLVLVFLWLNGMATLNGDPGDTRWTFQTSAAINSTPAMGVGGQLYVGSGDGKLYALDGATGDKKWDYLTGGAVDSDPVVGIDGTVYVASADAKLYALDGFAGIKKWECPIQSSGDRRNRYLDIEKIPCPAIGTDGTLYIGDVNGNFVALDGLTGSQKWVSIAASTNVITTAAIGADGTIYLIRGIIYNAGGDIWNVAICMPWMAPTVAKNGRFPLTSPAIPIPR
jgi:outer membrane protein assembly factor BamB